MNNKTKNTIIQRINDTYFDINCEANSTNVSVKKKLGNYELNFVAEYEQKVKDYANATYENPEEYSAWFEVTGITDVSIYLYDETFELTDDDIQDIKENLYLKLGKQ